MTPSEAQAAIAAAESARAQLAGSLRLPSFFYSSIGVSIAVQIACGAIGIAEQSTAGLMLVAVGVVVFALVAVVQLARFRRLNGAWVGGLASQVLMGTAGLASTAYVVAFGLASWAAFASGWLSTIAAVAGGVVYAWSGRRWWRQYQGAPAEHSRGGNAVVLGAAAAVTLMLLVALVVMR